MKKIFLILLITTLSNAGHCLIKDLKIAIYDFRPHVFIDPKNPEPSGAAIEFLTETIDLDSHYKIHWVASPFSRFLKDIESQKADMGLFLAKTPERQSLLRFPEQPFLITESGVILPKETPFTDLQSLKGRVLGHTLGSVVPPYLAKAEVKLDVLSGEDVIERNLRRLQMKRIDGVFVPTYSNGEYILHRLNLDQMFKIVKIPGSSLNLYIVYSKSMDDKTFNEINALIDKKRATYNSLLEKYLHAPPKSVPKVDLLSGARPKPEPVPAESRPPVSF